ncbi:VOC family protein [Amycolatopsis pithecellobii]|uniref:VOC family protein n=1 Tax=Amycolatopsis pithecellobii TaxID=664692 RepID=A0A6N7YWB2_9PSEU|nr:VOC family protein [Amycolatopsis pithecellobii]MTD57355.1 VOC family protein [Amycolatopsis pithecellobii]
MPRPVHFEIHASDPERAITFYTTVFEWSFERWGTKPYWLISTGCGPGIDGGLVPRQGPAPAEGAPVNAYPNTMEVPDVDAAVRRVGQAGGSVVVPKTALTGMGWLVYCTDTEGNIFGLLENDTSAE